MGVLLLDAVTVQPNAAFSLLRKLRLAYSGAAFKVRRASDLTVRDIGFVGANVDVADLLSFCAGTNGHVLSIYDQTTNGRHLLNGTSLVNSIPRVVNAGALEVNAGGRLACQFRATDSFERNDALGFSGSPAMTVASTMQSTATQDAYLWAIGTHTSAGGVGLDTYTGAVGKGFYFSNFLVGARDFDWTNQSASSYVVFGKPAGGGVDVFTCEHEGSSPAIFSTGATTALNISNTHFTLGAYANLTTPWTGKWNTLVAWESELAGADRVAMHAEMALHK